MRGTKIPARSHNQEHIPRQYTAGRRRLSIYWTWSYPWEAQRDPTALENRFSTVAEMRHVLWPGYEMPRYDADTFLQGIAGTLELYIESVQCFQDVAAAVTGHNVPVFQRVDQAGYFLPIDERVLEDCDTLLIFGLDHLLSGQGVIAGEVEAIKQWLTREGTCLLLAPHHDVGFTDSYEQRQAEYLHHGDALVPRQQRFSCYTRSLMKELKVPVWNEWGLRPATVPGSRSVVPLTKFPDLDKLGLFKEVSTFDFHSHLPHYALTEANGTEIHVLAKQPICLDRPHPFTAAGNTEFNSMLWMPPAGDRAGDILVVDSTHFMTLFGGTESVTNFWRNLATM